MRICVLGNSHVACLKEAWVQLEPLHPDFNVRFFASPRDGLSSLYFDDGCLKPSDPTVVEHIKFTSGGMEAIPLEEFDAFLVYGLRLSTPVLSARISRAVAIQCVADIAETSTNLHLCKTIIWHTSKPVYSGHVPMPAVARYPTSKPYHEMRDIMRSVLLRQGVVLVQQPDQTILPPIGTKEEYARGSKRLGIHGRGSQFHDEGEVQHMNAAFGLLMFESFLAMLVMAPEGANASQSAQG